MPQSKVQVSAADSPDAASASSTAATAATAAADADDDDGANDAAIHAELAAYAGDDASSMAASMAGSTLVASSILVATAMLAGRTGRGSTGEEAPQAAPARKTACWAPSTAGSSAGRCTAG